MNATAKDDFPLDLFGILGTRKITKGLATLRTAPFYFRQFMDLFDAGKIYMTFSAMTFGSRLLTPLATIGSG